MRILPRLRRLAAVGASAATLLALSTPASASAPPVDDAASPLGCMATIWDPGDELDTAATAYAIELTAASLGADVRVRAEQNLDSGLDARLDQLIEQCPGWSSRGELDDDMVVVMFSPTEREASVFYGAGLGPRLEERWEDAVDEMLPHLRDGDYTEAVDSALQTLRTGASQASSTGSSSSSSGSPGLPIALVVIFLGAVAAAWLYQLATGNASFGNGSTSWTSSSGRHRSRSWSSSSRGGSSRSRSRSSGGGSRRAGGGTKKW